MLKKNIIKREKKKPDAFDQGYEVRDRNCI